jgi:superfamily II DNA or RNA helicase
MIQLLKFQQDAVDNAVSIYMKTGQLLSNARTYKERATIIQHNGVILIEAPTGAGKTLIAGHVLQQLSSRMKVVWFWFAPFSGLVGQSASVIKAEFNGLRPRALSDDRAIGSTCSGDVFVTTWAAVATANKDGRKARTDGEESPSIDTLILALRADGYFIGTVIDEAHHGFNKARQSLQFYRDVIQPDFSILVTATPKDRDIELFQKETNIANLSRITISRRDCVESRLIKRGIRAVAFKSDALKANLIDFDATALKHGVEAHRKIQRQLNEKGIEITPLLLVQVDSSDESVRTTKKRLCELGFKESEIAVHTAKEPDPDLLALANDESKQVLIFKMAVALGFDAPRAFTLVSMRHNRDVDFGVQIVGRILRVDRRLQSHGEAGLLDYGYVFLADYEMQSGLTTAAEKINSIRTELASVNSNLAFVSVGVDGKVLQHLENGQTSLLSDTAKHTFVPQDTPTEIATDISLVGSGNSYESEVLQLIMPEAGLPPSSEMDRYPRKPALITEYIYPLRDDIEFPLSFKREVYPIEFKNITACIVARVKIDSDMLNVTRRRSVHVIKKELDIFDSGSEQITDTLASLSDDAIARKAQLNLFEADPECVNVQELYKLLMEKLRKTFLNEGWDDMTDDPSLKRGLDLILAAHPKSIKDAIRDCLADHAELEDAAPLPSAIKTDIPLKPSRLNLYRVVPDTLNSWEAEFADTMDNDMSGTILWWHRNDDRKPWAVSLVIPGSYDFYPDFIVGVGNRRKGNGILLVEVKREINDPRGDSIAKIRAEHKLYRQVMMVYWENEKKWYTVRYNEKSDKNTLDRIFDFDIMSAI